MHREGFGCVECPFIALNLQPLSRLTLGICCIDLGAGYGMGLLDENRQDQYTQFMSFQNERTHRDLRIEALYLKVEGTGNSLEFVL